MLELKNKHKCSFFLQFISVTNSWGIFKIIELGFEKHRDHLTGLVLTLWYVGFSLEKYSDYLTELELILYVAIGLENYSNYLTGFGLTLSVYDMLDVDLRNTQHKNYFTGLRLILLNTGLGLINQPSRNVVTKVWRLS